MADTLVGLLEESAQQFGSRPAVWFKPLFCYRHWTYSQLWEQAGQTATLLQSQGIKKGDRVVLWGPNSPQWVAAMFGIMRAGAVVVPLDLRSSPDFVNLVVQRTRPSLAFVSLLTRQSTESWEFPRLMLEELEPSIIDLPAPEPVSVGPEDLAEIIFTSGTTGDPKGVMLTHHNIVSDLEASSEYVPGKASYRVLSIMPLSHLLEQMGGLFTVIRCGASVTYMISRQPAALLRTLRERRITNMVVVPQALELFWNGIEREAQRKGMGALLRLGLSCARFFPNGLRRWVFLPVHQSLGGALQFIVTGGAALDRELGQKWELLGVKILQAYGATETSPVITSQTVKEHHPGSVGRAIPGVDLKVASDGEILVKGPIVMKGYWEAPEQTAAVMDHGWYRTGDLGELDSQGYLYMKGRKKDMIVLNNGMNVFPEDIEGVLKKHQAVSDAAVVGLSRDAGPEVHAVLLMNSPDSAQAAVDWANQQLADHQRIRNFTIWPEPDFPHTHTLKIRKGVLVERLLAGLNGAKQATVSQRADRDDPKPGTIAGLVARMKGLDPGVVTPQKTLGDDLDLDSLGRVELLSVIEEELGVYLDESIIVATTTVGELESMLSQSKSEAASMNFGLWGRQFWCRILRGLLQRLIVFPGLKLMYRYRIRGRENLNGLPSTVLFAANHTVRLDNALIIRSLPYRWRRRLAIAAWDHLWTSLFQRIIIPLFGNGFPFAKEGQVRSSLNNFGRLLDENWSVLIYPEGQRTDDGPMQPFLNGIGMVAVESQLPVVPIKVDIRSLGYPKSYPVLKRGQVEVRLGKPLTFMPGTTYPEATRVIEQAVATL